MIELAFTSAYFLSHFPKQYFILLVFLDRYICTYIHVCTNIHCIVLYLYIYKSLLAVHTNQKRFQCERPREERLQKCCSLHHDHRLLQDVQCIMM